MNKSLKSNKAAFLTRHDPDELVKQQRKLRSWMPHSVAVLVLSPRGDQVALVLPKKANGRGAEHVRVPPQVSLDKMSTVSMTGALLLRQLLKQPPAREKLLFLGSGRGNKYLSEVDVKMYGKWIHWVGVRLTATRDVFRKDSQLFERPYWCSANHLLAMDTFAMSDRKYVLTLQALLAFGQQGIEGKLIAKAGQQLRQVA